MITNAFKDVILLLMCVQEFSEQRFLRLFRYVRTDRTMTIKI